jgi:(p)ppGpp synthase/HD superfamily hydrolase
MTERAARAIAKTVHEGQTTAAGRRVFERVRRVAAAVPKQARVTAWLHDVLERTDLTIAQLRARGVSSVELSALVFLTCPERADYRF